MSLAPLAIRLDKFGGNWALFESAPWQEGTPEVYIANYFYNETIYQEGLIPETPFGILPVFPPNSSKEALHKFRWILNTDGGKVWHNDKVFDPVQAREYILSIAEKYKTTLPVQAEKVYVVANKLSEKSILVWLINSTEKGSKDISTILHFNIPFKHFLILDVETKKILGRQSKTLPIIVPAGGYRLIQVEAM